MIIVVNLKQTFVRIVANIAGQCGRDRKDTATQCARNLRTTADAVCLTSQTWPSLTSSPVRVIALSLASSPLRVISLSLNSSLVLVIITSLTFSLVIVLYFTSSSVSVITLSLSGTLTYTHTRTHARIPDTTQYSCRMVVSYKTYNCQLDYTRATLVRRCGHGVSQLSRTLCALIILHTRNTLYGASHTLYGASHTLYGASHTLYSVSHTLYGASHTLYGVSHTVVGACSLYSF